MDEQLRMGLPILFLNHHPDLRSSHCDHRAAPLQLCCCMIHNHKERECISACNVSSVGKPILTMQSSVSSAELRLLRGVRRVRQRILHAPSSVRRVERPFQKR